jgi:hypothetical protein
LSEMSDIADEMATPVQAMPAAANVTARSGGEWATALLAKDVVAGYFPHRVYSIYYGDETIAFFWAPMRRKVGAVSKDCQFVFNGLAATAGGRLQ